MRCIRHRWGKWTRISVKDDKGFVYDSQQRICGRCQKTQREAI